MRATLRGLLAAARLFAVAGGDGGRTMGETGPGEATPECTTTAECDDGLFGNGQERCTKDVRVDGSP